MQMVIVHKSSYLVVSNYIIRFFFRRYPAAPETLAASDSDGRGGLMSDNLLIQVKGDSPGCFTTARTLSESNVSRVGVTLCQTQKTKRDLTPN